MENEHEQQNLPLVPYPSEHREVILRSTDRLVLFDHRSRQVSLVNVDEPDPSSTRTVCPTCQRPFDIHEETPWSPSTFISPDYFRLLDHSRKASAQSSRSPSPPRLLRAPRADHSSSRVLTPQQPTVEEDDLIEETHAPFASVPIYGGPSSSPISSDSFSPGYFAKHFQEIKELGRGGFGVVLLVKHVISDHEVGKFALKRIPIGDDSSWLAKILKEVQLLQALNHRNLVQYKHVWLEDYSPSAFAPQVPHAFILQQYCNRGDLERYIMGPQVAAESADARGRRQSWGPQPKPILEARPMKPDEVFSFFKDIASGLGNLHQNGFIHRDLKPNNILLDESRGRLTALVSDFGESVGENTSRKSTGATGTLSWCAPEVLRRDESSGTYGQFSQKSDIFSLGLILHLMCFGRLPYETSKPFDETAENIDKLREEITSWIGLQQEYGHTLPEVLFASLKRLLSVEPSERPGTDEILRELKQFSIKSGERSNPFSDLEKRLKGGPIPASEPPEISISSRRDSPLADQSTEARTPSHSAQSPRATASTPPVIASQSNGSKGDVELVNPTKGSLIRRRQLLEQKVPLQLTSPPSRSLQLIPTQRNWLGAFSRRLGTSPRSFIKLCIFAAKAWTLFTPCQPLAMRTAISFPLLCMAAIDLLGSVDPLGLWASMALATTHAVILAAASQSGRLCRQHPAEAIL